MAHSAARVKMGNSVPASPQGLLGGAAAPQPISKHDLRCGKQKKERDRPSWRHTKYLRSRTYICTDPLQRGSRTRMVYISDIDLPASELVGVTLRNPARSYADKHINV